MHAVRSNGHVADLTDLRLNNRLAGSKIDRFIGRVMRTRGKGYYLLLPYNVETARLIRVAQHRQRGEGFTVHAWTGIDDNRVRVWVDRKMKLTLPERARVAAG